ncbi:hypothetical protein HELRODRAFT_87238, partial [Helobdella robusta]|uniref:Metalloendopeptidase n=1 Tax=Helobdella robusta TaxID=6412 RepID=T1G6N3_HELRO
REKRAAISRPHLLWDDGIIPFEFDTNFTGAPRSMIFGAMRAWENNTCVSFVEKTNDHKNYILFSQSPCGCCSFVGKKFGAQIISIGKHCDQHGIILHELGHVIGFFHEHTRPDRDSYVEILYDNILHDQKNNFYTARPGEVDSLNEPYDFQSIMHYARSTFSVRPFFDSIIPRSNTVNNHDMGQRSYLSKGDISQTNKLYKCPQCGKTLMEPKGTFSTPQYTLTPLPDTHGHYRSSYCVWRITGHPWEVITLTILSYDIPTTMKCYSNYLQVNDGAYYKSPLLGKVCGRNDSELVLTSTKQKMWLEYRLLSGYMERQPGFYAKYHKTCGGHIKKDFGEFSSPQHPEKYSTSLKCSWIIEVAENYSVGLTFKAFELERHQACACDFLEVYDGGDDKAPLLGKFCGVVTPASLQSTANKILVKFVSDYSEVKTGFLAQFQKEKNECETSDHQCQQTCVNTIGSYRCQCSDGFELASDGRSCIAKKDCEMELSNNTGTISSPSYPGQYPPNKNCSWLISVPKNHVISIVIDTLEIEGNDKECHDSLKILSGEKDLGVFCGSSPPAPIISEDSAVQLIFSSDDSINKQGFLLSYSMEYNECSDMNGGCEQVCIKTPGSYRCECRDGFTLNTNRRSCNGQCHREITNPSEVISFNNQSDSNTECTWLLRADVGKRIQINYMDAEKKSNLTCSSNLPKTYDGPDETYPKLESNVTPPNNNKEQCPQLILSSSNILFMKFKPNTASEGNSSDQLALEAAVSTVCGGMVEADGSVRLFSFLPPSTENSDDQPECEWLIQSKNKLKITLLINAIDSDGVSKCGLVRHSFV